MASSIPASLTGDPVSPWAEAWRRFRRHRMAVASLGVLALLVAAVVLGPFAWRMPIDAIDFSATMQGPSAAHPFGTDDLGQDLLARMLYGGRISLAVGVAAMGMAVLATEARRVTEEMFIVAARAVAEQVTEANLALGLIYPPTSTILNASLHTAARIAEYIFEHGLAGIPRPADIAGHIRAMAYKPVYTVAG